ncbi:hypothetical protein HDU96_001228 [Phlyctochytrium bullatum]|nr:hypothetical protein HDU96_001228 [Phlyctochytrium bullatum]
MSHYLISEKKTMAAAEKEVLDRKASARPSVAPAPAKVEQDLNKEPPAPPSPPANKLSTKALMITRWEQRKREAAVHPEPEEETKDEAEKILSVDCIAEEDEEDVEGDVDDERKEHGSPKDSTGHRNSQETAHSAEAVQSDTDSLAAPVAAKSTLLRQPLRSSPQASKFSVGSESAGFPDHVDKRKTVLAPLSHSPAVSAQLQASSASNLIPAPNRDSQRLSRPVTLTTPRQPPALSPRQSQSHASGDIVPVTRSKSEAGGRPSMPRRSVHKPRPSIPAVSSSLSDDKPSDAPPAPADTPAEDPARTSTISTQVTLRSPSRGRTRSETPADRTRRSTTISLSRRLSRRASSVARAAANVQEGAMKIIAAAASDRYSMGRNDLAQSNYISTMSALVCVLMYVMVADRRMYGFMVRDVRDLHWLNPVVFSMLGLMIDFVLETAFVFLEHCINGEWAAFSSFEADSDRVFFSARNTCRFRAGLWDR